MTKPFTIFNWHSPFLPAFVDYICEQSHNSPGLSVIILPHDRPRRYLTDVICKNQKIKKPMLLPQMLTMSEVIGQFCAQSTALLQNASLLDQIYLIYKSVKHVANTEGHNIGKHFATMELAQFIPWGMRLAALFEEYMLENIEVKGIAHTEGEVSDKAAALLSFLGQIHIHYLNLLHQEKWTSDGLNALFASRATHIPHIFDTTNVENKHIFIAGFLNPNKTEDIILKKLWNNGAHICLHTDPQIVYASTARPLLQENVHWSCVSQVKWLRKWRAKCHIHEEKEAHTPRMHFVSGYDLHSQLLAVKQLLAKPKKTVNQDLSTAIVLTNPSLLTPIVHHLPDQDFNVSIGYPLNKSPLFALINAITKLHTLKNSAGKGSYYWRHILHCINHPYIKSLKTLPQQSINSTQDLTEQISFNPETIRHILHKMEQTLRNSSRFVVPNELLEQALKNIEHVSQAQVDLMHEILTALFDNFSKINSTHSLAQALMHLCQILLNYGFDIWTNSPIDAEALFRLLKKIIPSLQGSALAHEILPISTLFEFLQNLMQSERVPFAADPITGLQILGLMETRLLHFEQVIIVDATDDVLPGFAAQDPLLPDALRHMLGLQDSAKREQAISHNLHRLMATANDVHFFWQEGISSTSLFDGKKSRSRFIDSAIWQEELKRGYIIKNNDEPLKTVPCVLSPIKRQAQKIHLTSNMQKVILHKLQHGISPTSLNSYLHCPQQFIYENIYGLAPLDEVNEHYNPLEVGNLLHEVLQNFYTPLKGTDVYAANLDSKLMDKYFNECLEHAQLNLPPDSLIMLKLAAPMRLRRFLQNQPERTHILALEQPCFAPVQKESAFKIMGILDRIDLRHIQKKPYTVVLDYKTGKLPTLNKDIWSEHSLWQDLQCWTEQNQNSNELLKQLSQSFASIQLPCYVHLCRHNFKYSVFDAAWVNLADDGKEIFLLCDDMEQDTRENIIQNQIPVLLNFILQHMATAKTFSPHEGEHCNYCPYGALCSK